MTYIVTAPLVVVRDQQGASHHFYEGAPLPSENLDEDHVKQLLDGKMIAKESDSKADTVDAILAEVGDDKDKASAALEQEKAGKNRSTLVSKLEAIANPGS